MRRALRESRAPRIIIGLVLGALLAACPKSQGDKPAKTPQAQPEDGAQPEVIHRSYKAMGTQITITAYTTDKERAVSVMEQAFKEFDRLEKLLTTWLPQSDVSKLNKSAGGPAIKVAPEVISILQKAISLSRLTEGKFDVTFGALSGLWRFDHQNQDNKIPPEKEIKKRLPFVGYENIEVDAERQTARLRKKGVSVHLGGIGKGYAVDRAVALIREQGFKHFMVQAGGDLYVAGRKGDRAWRVGIRDPRGGRSTFFAAAEVTDATFSTSGDYERFFIKDGKRYHHIIDPDLGRPSKPCRSVTVMAPDAMTADALSTGIFILGAKKGLEIAEKTPGVGVVIVDNKNQVHVSSRLRDGLKRFKDPTDGI